MLAVSLPLSADIQFPMISVFFGFLCCGPGDAGAAALVLQQEGCAFSCPLFSCRMFVAQQIASSNLLLLITDAACDCSVFPPVLLDAKEVKYILPCAARMHGSTGPLISMFARVENMLPGQLLQGWGHGPTCGTAGERQGAGRVAVWWRGGNDSAIQPPQGDAHLHWPGCQIRCTRVRVGQARRKGQWWGGCSWAGSPTLLPGASVTHPCWILIPRSS